MAAASDVRVAPPGQHAGMLVDRLWPRGPEKVAAVLAGAAREHA
ncbi:MAG TPA: hypothetical protein VFG87_08535 [Amycolatopsis sp.]|nr:hypothetical protein [Amycolatopsis sp.]